MEPETNLPKRLVAYIHDIGVRSLDHLADTIDRNGAPAGGASPSAVQSLVGQWRTMAEADKQAFVDKVAAAVVEVVAASALLPVGLKRGKKAAKSARKVIRKRAKALRKSVKAKKVKKATKPRGGLSS